MRKIWYFLFVILLLFPAVLPAQKVRTLTFEQAAEIAIKNSFSIQDLELDLRRKNYGHIASLAGLKSRVDLAMTTPELKQEREEKFDEGTGFFEVYKNKTTAYDTKLSITQPLRTNGNISGNINLNLFSQAGNVPDYTTVVYMRLDQPIFRPNDRLKNIYKAELSLEKSKISYISQRISLIYGATYSQASAEALAQALEAISGRDSDSGSDRGRDQNGGGDRGGSQRGGSSSQRSSRGTSSYSGMSSRMSSLFASYFGRGGSFRAGSLSQYYYQLYENSKLLEFDTRFYDIWEDLLNQAQIRFDAGELSEREFLQINVQFSSSRNRLLTSSTKRDASTRALIQFLTLDPNEKIRVIDELEYVPIEIDEQKALEEGIKNNRGIRNFMIGIIEDSMRIEDTEVGGKMTGDLSGTFGLNNSDTTAFRMYYSDFNQQRSLNLGFKKPVWDWGRNAMRVESAKINLETQRRQLENDITDTKRQIIGHIYNIRNMQERIDLISRAKELAERSMKIAREKFINGGLSSEDLILAVTTNYTAQIQYLQLVVSYKNALIQLANQTQWDFEKNRSIREEIEKIIDNVIAYNSR